ncbi:Calcipressin [Boletus edulis]|uniref:Calcipressin n=1 Tax=Boletus edulis BED1 TaxID=1328754 RepID=A0AAD4BQW7_BOLED|nr:Calcipressin [Boletus edulis]KAF8437462.1 Calcipressin [Boletus edulis BED1]
MPSISIISVDSLPHSPTKGPEFTNTLLITQVPQDFFQPIILEALRDFFSLYGEINQWAPLSCFSRIIVVYSNEDSAEQAKRSCDPLIIQPSHGSPTTLRVFRADRSPLMTRSPPSGDNFLRPPPVEKNFLISPPGSPPVGWEQTREVPPNTATLAEDLITALKRLQMRERHRGREVLLEPEEGVGVGVYVEDADESDSEVDGEEELDWEYGSPSPASLRWRPAPTAMPPMPVTLR